MTSESESHKTIPFDLFKTPISNVDFVKRWFDKGILFIQKQLL